MMSTVLCLLIVEDNPYDAELQVATLEEAGYVCQWERVETRAEFLTRLAPRVPGYDLILADYDLPAFDGLAALKLFLEHDLDLPFILVSSTPGEETATESLKAGATDYVLKDRLSRLGMVVQRALREKEEQRRRKQAEESLRAAGHQWQVTFDAIGDTVCLLALEGIILRCNAATAKLVEKPPHEIIGRTYWKLLYGAAEPIPGCPVVRMQETQRRETMVMPMDDRWFNVVVDPLLDKEGRLMGSVYRMTDITELKLVKRTLQRTLEQVVQAKQEWEITADSLSELVCLLDAQGRIIRTNRTIERWGLSSVVDAKGREIQQLFHPEWADFWQLAWAELLQGRSLEREVEDGHLKRHLHVQARPILTRSSWRDRVGAVFAAVVIRDITERKRVEEALQKRTHELGERVKELNCLYAISNLLEERGVSLESILEGVVNLIPPAWRYPEITCARLVWGDNEFRTENFRVTAWGQTRDIIVHDEPSGAVQVYYL
ncbi:MAG: PAS domain-containing protein [Anaerolineae bacterium]